MRGVRLAVLGLGALVPAGCSEYDIHGEEHAEELPLPAIAVDPTSIDFGEVLAGERPERTFTLTNTGGAPLWIDAAEPTGEGFAVGADPSGSSLDPGEEAEGTVVFTGGPGEQFAQLRIQSDAPATPEVMIDLRGLSFTLGLAVAPDPLDFGAVEIGAEAVASVTLTNLSDRPLDLTGAAVGEPFWLAPFEPLTLDGGASQPVEVRFSPIEPGPYADRLVFSVARLGEVGAEVKGVGGSPPQAVCSGLPAEPIVPEDTVTWVGSGSTDPEGRPLAYQWTLIERPAGSAAALPVGPGPDLEGFAPDVPGDYVAELVVTNDLGASDRCEARITAISSGPVAVCSVSPNPAIAIADEVTWSGVGSSDPAGGALTYSWSLVGKPAGSTAVMPGGAAGSPDRVGFVPDLAGIYTGELVVTDPHGESSAPCRVDLEAVPGEDLWVEMFWSHSGEDMDLHLIRGNGAFNSNQDCYYSNCIGGLAWGAAGPDDDPSLDLDDIPGTGPENINIAFPEDLIYQVWVHDYPGHTRNAATDVTVNVYLGGTLAWTDTRSISGERDRVHFADIDWATQTVTP